MRDGQNPARWRGHLAKLLPARSKVLQPVKHHAALSYAELPGFMTDLRTQDGSGARILHPDSGKRRRGARRNAGREQGLGRSGGAHEGRGTMKEAEKITRGDIGNVRIFPGARPGRPIADVTMTAVLRRMRLDATTHGFRSAFRTWCGERTNFPREIAEAALAHAAWEAYAGSAPRSGDVVPIRQERAS
jgi:hypothetical protein